METPGEHLVSLFLRFMASDFERAVAQGEVDLVGTSLDDALDTYIANWEQDLSDETLGFEVTLDYSKSILQEARQFHDSNRFQFAIIFYAMWIEHWANRMLVDGAQRHGLGDRSVKLFARKLSVIEKLEVAWDVFKWGEFPGDDLKATTRVMDVRNSFVHYKYLAFPINENHDEAARDACVGAEVLIPKLQSLESQVLYGIDSDEEMAELRSAILERLRARGPADLPLGGSGG